MCLFIQHNNTEERNQIVAVLKNSLIFMIGESLFRASDLLSIRSMTDYHLFGFAIYQLSPHCYGYYCEYYKFILSLSIQNNDAQER